MKKMITCLLNKINLSKMNRYKHDKLTKILTITLLVLILLSVFTISFMHLSSYAADDISSNSVTDLTNTTWYVPSGWSATASYGKFYIEWDELIHNPSFPPFTTFEVGYSAGSISQANSVSWFNDDGYYENYFNNIDFCISISGGLDVTNTSLISWLETNGTQLKVTDLTDTTWNVPYGWEASAGYGVFNINCIASGGDYYNYSGSEFCIGYSYDRDEEPTVTSANTVSIAYVVFFTSDDSVFVEFSSGTDTTNPKLIAWLSKYGELQGEDSEPEPDPDPVTTYDLPDTIWYFDDVLIWNGMLQYYDDFMATEFLMPYNQLSITSTGDLINGIDVIMTYYDDDDDTVVVYNSNLGGWQIDEIGARAIYFPLNFDTTGPLYDSLKTFMNTNATLIVEPKHLRQVYFDDGRSIGYTDGYNIGYSKGESNTFVTGFFGNFLTGIVQAIDSIHFYEYTIDDMGTEDVTDDEVFYISPWSIFVVFIGLALVIIFLKVFRGG